TPAAATRTSHLIAFYRALGMSFFFCYGFGDPRHLHSFPTRRSSDLKQRPQARDGLSSLWPRAARRLHRHHRWHRDRQDHAGRDRSEEHTSELQSRENLVCRLLLEKKKERTLQASTTTVAMQARHSSH